MMRGSFSLILVLTAIAMVVAVAPANASDGYSSLNSITGPVSDEGQPGSSGYSSVNALVPPVSTNQSPASSANDDLSSLSSIVGPVRSPQQLAPTVQLADEDGFNWSDALVGALIGSSLALMAYAGTRLVGRHRRTTAESRA